MKQGREDFDVLCNQGEISGPVDDTQIGKAEAELGVEFPTEYRELLRQYGAVIARGVQVYGLLPKEVNNSPPLWQDVVSVTNELRDCGQVGTERPGFIPISDDGTGVYFYLDTSEAPKTTIYAIGPGVEKKLDTD